MGDEECNRSHWAKKIWDVLVKENGCNLPAIVIGRQMAVSMCFFISARGTTILLQNGDGNIVGVSNPLQEFFNTGLLGALIVSVAGSITWQLVATSYPMAVLLSPFAYVLMRCCLLLDMTGLCQGAWLVSRFQRLITGFHLNEVYLRDAEDDHQITLGQPGKENTLSVYYLKLVYQLPLSEWFRFVQIWGEKLVLDVFGAARAIWGFAKVITLHTPETNEFWQINAIFFFCSTFSSLGSIYVPARWNVRKLRNDSSSKPKKYPLELEDGQNEIDQFGSDGLDANMSLTASHPIQETKISEYYPSNVYHLPLIEWVRFIQMLGAKLVLEVFGAARAIWGFAEVLTLRTSETNEFWRMNASIVGAVFFVCYLFFAWTYLCERSVIHASNHHLKLKVDEPMAIEGSRPINSMGELTA